MPKKNNIYVCDCCGKEFIPYSSTIKKYERGEQKTLSCSKECSNNLKRKKVIVYCENCGCEIERKKSHYIRQIELGQHQYCSLKCQKEFIHKNSYEYRKCEICGREFECPKISTQRFCSVECQSKWQSTIVGDLNPRSTKIYHNCDYCGKEYLMKKYKTKQEHNFCSFECQKKWFDNVFIQTDEYKQKSRERAIKMLEDGKMPEVYTKPQILINNLLDNNNVKYKNNYNIRYYSIDNYLIDYNLMIEVMGDYWHSNPLVFEYQKLNSTQLKRIPKDKAKHTYTKNNYDVEILYLWESDINSEYNKCEKLIQLYIDQGGMLENYHSFNYSIIDENKLVLNKHIINSYYD